MRGNVRHAGVGDQLSVVPITAEPGEGRIERAAEGHIDVAHVQHAIAVSQIVDGGVVAGGLIKTAFCFISLP